MKRFIKDQLYQQFSRSTKALANPRRLELLDLLLQGEKSVETLSEQTGLGLKNTSAQLKELKSALLVSSRREGKNIFYSIANPHVTHLLLSLKKFNETHFAEIQKIATSVFGDIASLDPANKKQLIARAKKGEVLIVDVRPHDEYLQTHLPFAVSIPMNELAKEVKNLPKNKEIFVYCRGAYCFFAKEAVEFLTKRGFNATKINENVAEWSALGLPLEREAI